MDHYWGENSGIIDHPFLKMSDKSMSRSHILFRQEDRQQQTMNIHGIILMVLTHDVI